ncbi:MAG: aminotransferase class I/II-fold pyridoxal phosphate-dependent enzyme [Anaerolineae bacterium]
MPPPIEPFALERYFAQHEFSAPYLLSPSDIEPLTLSELLALASEQRRLQWDQLWLGYTESQGHPELLQAISSLYRGITPEQVLTVVPEEGIYIIMRTLLQPDDHVIVMYPGYQSLYAIAESRGVQVSYWQPADMWRFDVDALLDLLQPNTRMVIVNSPHNPTGAHFNHQQWQAVIDFARTHDLYLFSDEMYRLSEHETPYQLASACEEYNKAITLSGLSKAFALPGLRVGWLVTQDHEARRRAITYKDYTTICGSAPSEILALMALDAREPILTRNRAILHENMTHLSAFFAEHSELFSWVAPHAGTVTLVKYKHKNLSVTQLAEQWIEQLGVMIVPASIFAYQGEYFRLGFGRHNLPKILEKVSDHLTS